MHSHSNCILCALLLIILLSGCTSIRDQGLVMSLQADPPVMFSETSTLLHIDIDNRNQKSIRNVVVDLFDTGLLADAGLSSERRCSKYFDRLLPYEFQSITCRLNAPRIVDNTVQTQVNALVAFDSRLDATQIFEVISENEYQRRLASRSYEPGPGSYIYSDKNVMIKIDFNEQLPLVIRPGKEYFVYFTITNVGNGFIQFIKPGDLVISPVGSRMPLVVKCPPRQTLAPVGKEFPRIACELSLPPQFLAGDDLLNADFVVAINYRYEMRESLPINIIK